MLSETQMEIASELRKKGASDPKIAAILGVTTNEVVYWRKKNNLPSGFRVHGDATESGKCRHGDDCLHCPRIDCQMNGPFPRDLFYNEMVNEGMNESQRPQKLVLEDMKFGRSQENPFPKRCLSCKYRRPLHSSVHSSMRVCYYCLDNDKPRGCSVQECAENKIHYQRRERKKRGMV